jgi:hypothetical protein
MQSGLPDQDRTHRNLDTGKGLRHPFKEIVRRSSDPALIADTVIRTLVRAWDLVSPTEFSVLYRQIRSRTMCSNARLRALHRAVKYVIQNDVKGDLVECGCARGGSAALMALSQRRVGGRRPLWIFDTFEGLPAPTEDDPDYEIAGLFTGTCQGTVEEVQNLFNRLEVAEEVHLIKGLFQDTLPCSEVRQIALLHIDGDWYASVKTCLENLYDKVTPGGIIQFDDYGYWKGARKAVDEFLQKRGIRAPMRRIDYSGRLLLKPMPLE